jgi:hypothetical protein
MASASKQVRLRADGQQGDNAVQNIRSSSDCEWVYMSKLYHIAEHAGATGQHGTAQCGI